METSLYSGLGFLLFEALRFLERYKKGEPHPLPREADYYILLIIILISTCTISYGINVQPVLAAIILGWSMPNGLEKALKSISNYSTRNNNQIDDISPSDDLKMNLIDKILTKYYNV